MAPTARARELKAAKGGLWICFSVITNKEL